MTKDEQKRKNYWDEEDENTSVGIREKRTGESANGTISTKADDSLEIEKKINEAKVLLDQTHQLYTNYFNRVEKRAPVDKARILESKVLELRRLNSNLTTAKFKLSQFINQYTTMRELWDRKLRERDRQ